MDDIDIISKILDSGLSEIGVILAFVATFVLKPLWKRVDGFGNKLDEFLVASQGRVSSSMALAKEIRKLAKSMPKRKDDLFPPTP